MLGGCRVCTMARAYMQLGLGLIAASRVVLVRPDV